MRLPMPYTDERTKRVLPDPLAHSPAVKREATGPDPRHDPRQVDIEEYIREMKAREVQANREELVAEMEARGATDDVPF